MTLQFDHAGHRYSVPDGIRHSIAIPMQFDGPQPNHFGADRAERNVLRLGDFIGDTEQGGSCNVDAVRLIPHCNGTHTETVSHIVNEHIWIGHAGLDLPGLAVLVSVSVTRAAQTSETYRPLLDEDDKLITSADLQRAFRDYRGVQPVALIIRTLPNDPARRSRSYSSANEPPFLTVEAMSFVNHIGCRHLLIDQPSVDRMYDDGLLTNHHIFWNVPEGTHALAGDSWQDKTITEMIFVPDEVTDGLYFLNLQFPAFASDAAPSRPVLSPISHIDGAAIEAD